MPQPVPPFQLRVTAATVGLLLATATPIPAVADTQPLWGQIANWQIRVDRTVGNGCFMVSLFARGTLFRVGYDMTTSMFYMTIGNEAWRSLTQGQSYPLDIRIGSEAPWSVKALATEFAGMTALVVRFREPGFLTELAEQPSITFLYQGREVTTLHLVESAGAVASLLTCQKSFHPNQGSDIDAAATPDNPFAATDPFRPSASQRQQTSPPYQPHNSDAQPPDELLPTPRR